MRFQMLLLQHGFLLLLLPIGFSVAYPGGSLVDLFWESSQLQKMGLDKRTTTNSIQIGPASAFSIFSSSCANALSAPLNCSAAFYTDAFLGPQSNVTAANLTDLCTSACTSSIGSYRSNVVKSCANDVYTDPATNNTQNIPGTLDTFQIYNNQRLSIKPVAFADWFITTYNLNCLTDSSSPPQWCQVRDQSNSSSAPNNSCNICRLKALKTQMSDGRLYDPGLASMYSTLTKSCGSTSLGAIVSPTPDFASVTAGSNSTTSMTTSTCTGSMVSIPTGQSCVDFARNNNISTDHLMDINSLSGNCANWPGNRTSLCVEDDCKPYVVGTNDTCPSVANANNITITQLLSWNPYIDPLCKNFNQKVGKVICLSSPFGYTPPPSNSFGNGPAPATTAAPVPSTADSSSNKNCGNWYLVQPGDYCSLLCTKNGISLSDFLFLNPDINGNCTNLLAGESYCVEAVGDISTYPGYGGSSSSAATATSSMNFSTLSTYTMPTFSSVPTATGFPLANGSITGCYSMLNNNQGPQTCDSVASSYGVSIAQFLNWNPSLGNISTYGTTPCVLANNTQYCAVFYNPAFAPAANYTVPYVPKPTSAPSNSTSACYDWWYTMQGDTCQSILNATSNTLADFYSWNPTIGSNCQNLWLNTSYCVFGASLLTEVFTQVPATSLPSSTTSSSSTKVLSSSSTTKVSTSSTMTIPASTQAGIASNCNSYYVAKAGDGCSAIAASHSIYLSEFDSWNPAVKTDCSGLWASYAYCVNTPGATHITTAHMQKRATIPPGARETADSPITPSPAPTPKA